MHSPSKSERLWFSHFLESKSAFQPALGNEHKERIQKLLSRSEVFDNFLQQKFPNLKRVSYIPLERERLVNTHPIPRSTA